MISRTVLNILKPSYFWHVWCPKCAPRRRLPQVLASSLELLECAGTSRPKLQHRCNPYNYPRKVDPSIFWKVLFGVFGLQDPFSRIRHVKLSWICVLLALVDPLARAKTSSYWELLSLRGRVESGASLGHCSDWVAALPQRGSAGAAL